MLATLGEPPSGPGRGWEWKWDGVPGDVRADRVDVTTAGTGAPRPCRSI